MGPDLTETFNALKANDPELAAGTIPLGLGSTALVVAHPADSNYPDGSVSKIFWRHATEAAQTEAHANYLTETHILRLLGGRVFGDVQTPVLLSENGALESRHYFASYRMTRMPGSLMDEQKFFDTAAPDQIKKHLREIGALAAHFHTEAATLLESINPPLRGLKWGRHIPQVSGFDPRMNEALAEADKYFRVNMKAGVIHGDLHHRNFTVDANHKITGLFDFSFSGMNENNLMDFAILPSGLDTVLDEYQKQSGKSVDRAMMTMTSISLNAAILNWHYKNPNAPEGIVENNIKNLKTNLNQIRDITGLSF
ncbi:MAG: hypothetical protein JWO78_1865 [Micavibrio sp.]|nr:hypothetical protein [Micavibrio sp.]